VITTGIRTFFRSFLSDKAVEITPADYAQDAETAAIEAYALNTVIDLVAGLLASCELRIFENGQPVKRWLWYRLNVLPNRNQTAAEFWLEVWRRLLFFGEVLIVPREPTDELIIADSFTTEPYIAFDTVFSNISRDGFELGRRTMSEVYYLNRRSPRTQSALANILAGYSKLINSAADAVSNDSGTKGILNITAQAQQAQGFEERYKTLMNDYFRSWFKNKNAVLPLWGGMTFTPSQTKSTSSTSRVTEYKTLFDDAVKRVAAVYGVAPALLSGDVAGLDEALNYTFTGCIDPLAKAMSTMLTARNFDDRDIVSGSRISADTSCIEHTGIFRIAANIDKLLSSGMYSIDELRERLGDHALGEDWSEMHYLTKNYDGIEATGGEEE